VHEGRVLALNPNFNASGLRQILKHRFWVALGKLRAIKVYPHFDAALSGLRERLHDRPIG
jgi:hypothetical protein